MFFENTVSLSQKKKKWNCKKGRNEPHIARIPTIFRKQTASVLSICSEFLPFYGEVTTNNCPKFSCYDQKEDDAKIKLA